MDFHVFDRNDLISVSILVLLSGCVQMRWIIWQLFHLYSNPHVSRQQQPNCNAAQMWNAQHDHRCGAEFALREPSWAQKFNSHRHYKRIGSSDDDGVDEIQRLKVQFNWNALNELRPLKKEIFIRHGMDSILNNNIISSFTGHSNF